MRPRDLAPIGDAALRWSRDVQDDGSDDVRALLDALRAWPRVVDAVVTESSVMVTFDPAAPPDEPWRAAENVAAGPAPPREHVLPVRYDGADLDLVAEATGLTRDAVATIHAECTYVVRVVGFLPGFAYLGDVPRKLVLPRRATPRPRVPAGAVAIAGGYTGVYPFASPGGWNLIGTVVDVSLFDAAEGARLALGDRVRFVRVT